MVDEIRPNQAITHSKLLYDSPCTTEQGALGATIIVVAHPDGNDGYSNLLVTGRGNSAAAQRILAFFDGAGIGWFCRDGITSFGSGVGLRKHNANFVSLSCLGHHHIGFL